MAAYREDRGTDNVGHGTRAGFRYVSIFGIVAFVLLVIFFVWGPAKSPRENPPAGENNTQLEKNAAPPPQPANPATSPEVEPTAPAAPSPQPATP